MSDNVSSGSLPAPAATSGADHLLARLIGVIFSPQSTFTRIVAQPRWLGALAVVTVSVSLITFAFLSTEAGQTAWLDQQVRQSEAFGRPTRRRGVPRTWKALRRMSAMSARGITLVIVPVMTLAISGLLLASSTRCSADRRSFKQVAAVLSHAGAVSLVQQLFIFPLNYARESMSSATNLGVFVPFLDESNIVSRFLGTIDLFIVWWLIVVAIGLGVLYRRKTAPIFWSFMGVYVVIALVIALVMRGASGGA